jgi:plastocyanin
MRTTPLVVSALLGFAMWAGTLDVAAAGTIKGTVRLAGAVPAPRQLKVTVDHAVCGTVKDAEDLVVTPGMGIRNVVVSLAPPPAGAKFAPAPPPQMDQKQCVFVPRVVVVPVGGTVEFLNNDRLLHNLHSASTNNAAFNRTQPKGRTIPIEFRKPEIIRIDCDLHPWMRAWVVVADHPFYAVTDERGEFLLVNVPPGRYTLHVWQESLGTTQSEVTVPDGEAIVVVEMRGK